MKDKYSQFKSGLINRGYLTRDIEQGIGIPLPSPDTSYNPILGDFLRECVKIDGDTILTPEQKYTQLLHRGMKTYVDGLKSVSKSTTLEFKKFLDENIKDKNDALFFLRYAMTADILKHTERNRIWSRVLEGKMTTKEASDELKSLAYQRFLKADNNQIKKGCARIILSDVNKTDIEKIDESCEYDNEDVSPCYSRIFYDARAVTDPKYNTYRENLQRLFSKDEDDTRENLPEMMNLLFDGLGNQANELYQDPKETEETKANCNKLMEEIVVYRSDLAAIRSKQASLSSASTPKKPEYEEEIKRDLINLKKRGEKINDKINQLSADTSSKRWGKIIFFAGIVVALGIITGGFGLGIGIDWMMRSIRSDSEFFKTNKQHHALVSQARKLIKQSDTAVLDLALPGEQTLPEQRKSMGPEDIEMEDMSSKRGGNLSKD